MPTIPWLAYLKRPDRPISRKAWRMPIQCSRQPPIGRLWKPSRSETAVQGPCSHSVKPFSSRRLLLSCPTSDGRMGVQTACRTDAVCEDTQPESSRARLSSWQWNGSIQLDSSNFCQNDKPTLPNMAHHRVGEKTPVRLQIIQITS